MEEGSRVTPSLPTSALHWAFIECGRKCRGPAIPTHSSTHPHIALTCMAFSLFRNRTPHTFSPHPRTPLLREALELRCGWSVALILAPCFISQEATFPRLGWWEALVGNGMGQQERRLGLPPDLGRRLLVSGSHPGPRWFQPLLSGLDSWPPPALRGDVASCRSGFACDFSGLLSPG